MVADLVAVAAPIRDAWDASRVDVGIFIPGGRGKLTESMRQIVAQRYCLGTVVNPQSVVQRQVMFGIEVVGVDELSVLVFAAGGQSRKSDVVCWPLV